MFWVLQENFFDAHAFAELRRQLDAQDCPHRVVRVNARTLEIAPPVEVVEINAIGSSAFYAGDIGRFVAAINGLA